MAQQNPRKPRQFKSEAAERAYWEARDNADYYDWSATTSVKLPPLEAPPSSPVHGLRQRLLALLGGFRRKPDFDAKIDESRRR